MNPLALAIGLALMVPCQMDSELSAFVEARRKLADDPARPIADREAVALELATTLDRAAWSASSATVRRSIWAEARGLLDGFSARNGGHPRSRAFAFQAAVYLWAEGQSWAKHAESSPTDREAVARAISAFDAAIARLRPLDADPAIKDRGAGLSQNIRYRLALALADRAEIDPDRPSSPSYRDEALKALSRGPFPLANLEGHADLLRAKLLAASGRFDEAMAALDEASRADPPPPMADRLAAMVPIAAGRKRFGEARAALEAAPIDDAAKDLFRIRLGLAERATLLAGPDRAGVEAEVVRRIGAMRAARPADARLALLGLARSIEEFGPDAAPEAWSLLAEGAALLGQPDRAASLDVIAAAKYEARGDAPKAREARFRAGAVLFGAGRFPRCDAILSRLVDDAGAGTLRARAGMLRALARGRRLATDNSDALRLSYEQALAQQIKLFPDDPTTGEARWLLGRSRLERGDRAEAERLWASVPRSHGRWLDARLAEITLLRDDLRDRLLVDPSRALEPALASIRDDLDRLAHESRTDDERADVALERIRVELIPNLGNPEAALNSVEKLRRLPLREDQREIADRLRIVAMAEVESFLDAEREARNFATSRRPEALLALARDLDRGASSADSERVIRRIGEVARLVADRLDGAEGLDGPTAAEARLRRARSKMLAGDVTGSRAILDAWPESAGAVGRDPILLAELADCLLEAGRPERAIVAYREVAHRLSAGSPQWFAARLEQARALEGDGHWEAARRLVEGTTILYPDLGGPVMKARYEALGKKLNRS